MTGRLDSVAKSVVIDTCAVWNVLSSSVLHRQCTSAGFSFALTDFGVYECLHKPRSSVVAADERLRARLVEARSKGQFAAHSLSIADLQEVARVEKVRKGLGKGELAAIAFARRVGIGLQTDDQKARRVATSQLGEARVQTTPHVLGWLFYEGRLIDSDFPGIVEEHESFQRPLRPYFQETYQEALRCRLMVSAATSSE